MKFIYICLFISSVLASLNLPAAIEDLSGDSVPTSLLEKAQQLRNGGGVTALNKMMQDLPELLERNREILNEVSLHGLSSLNF